MFKVGDHVIIIDPFSRYFKMETKIVAVCGVRRVYYHLRIDGESRDWFETELMKILG